MADFNFHYVTTPTGEISGQSVLTQTEDAINSIGEVAQKAEDEAASAVSTATEALTTANSAQSAANNAVATAEAATEKAETMTKVVQSYDARITSAEATATAAAQSASASAANATKSAADAKDALTAAQASEKSAQTAANTAQTAQSTAEQAVTQATAAQAAATTAQAAAETAKSDATAAQTAAANSASTAATALKSAYALRATTKTLKGGDTVATSDLTPSGNVKTGDLVIDATASLLEISSLDDGTAVVAEVETPFVQAVSYAAAQSLTTAQQKQALSNIGAVSYLDNTLTEAQAIQTLKNLKFDVGSAAFANSIWGGRNLLDIYTEAQINSKVAAGDFSGMFIGDYIMKTITVDGTAYTNAWRCAHFDYYLGIGDTECTTHHIVMVPDGIVGTAQMNSTNTTTGGFKGSAMWTTTLPKYASVLQSAFGSAHVLKHRYLITDSMNSSLISMAGANWTGAVPIWSWQWIDCYANLMTEHMVYGQPIYSSSAADSASYHTQLALFHLRPQLIHCRPAWWLSAVASSDYFANVSGNGSAGAYYASYSIGVRPLFLWS